MIPADVLIKAYQTGIFPMSDSRHGEVRWYTADPRGVLFLDEFHCPKKVKKVLRSGRFYTRIDHNFEGVILGCADAPRGGTWISDEIIESYINLHQLGYAHSVETYLAGTERLVGGLYGVALGGIFFGESMFHSVDDASKVALVRLVEHLKKRGFIIIDMQMLTELTRRFGGRLISKQEYLKILEKALQITSTFC